MSFKVGQKVVYPNHGVTVVEDIASTQIDGAERTCYHLRLLSSNSKVMVPKDNLDLVGLRPLCEIKEIRNVLGILENGSFDAQKDWKGRYKQNVEKMKTGRITEVAEVLRNLKFVSQKKSLSFREKKMYERARHFIVSEVAHVKGLSERDAEAQVEKALSSSLAKRARTAN
ncbi:MAG: CarD family transcriptional regulator [Acidobacteriota bacterium]